MKTCVECIDCVVKRGRVRCRNEWWFNEAGDGQRRYKWITGNKPPLTFYERMRDSVVMQGFAKSCKKWEGELDENSFVGSDNIHTLGN